MSGKKIIAIVAASLTTVVILHACSNGSDPTPSPAPPESLPVLTVNNMNQPIAAANSTMQFYFSLSKASTQTVTVDYRLVDGTALASKDYTAANGTLTFPAGNKQQVIDVQITGDPTNLRRPNPEFTVQLSNAKNCTLGNSSATGTILTEDGTYLPTDTTGYTTPKTYPGYNLVWSDEFNGSNLDLTVWNQEIGNGTGGWGNHELEYYTNSQKNCLVSAGNLIIEARNESTSGFNYTSTRLTTQNKKTFKFGRIDIRAKLPVAKGMWPALWMLGSNISSVGWPKCGETDIMELVGTYPSRVSGTAHWANASGQHASKGDSYNLSSGDFSKQFHVFSLVWKQDTLQWLIDDHLYVTVTAADAGSTYPFNADQFFIFNVAVGGDWPGPPDSSTAFPQRMFVDYVRVFQQ